MDLFKQKLLELNTYIEKHGKCKCCGDIEFCDKKLHNRYVRKQLKCECRDRIEDELINKYNHNNN